MAKVLLRTLGCRLNQAESFEIEQGLLSCGFELAEASDEAEVVIVNTCTVTADSSRSSRRLIAKSVRENPNARIVVTGCYAVAAPHEVRSMEGVDAVVANKDKDSIVGYLKDVYFPASLTKASAPPVLQARVTLKVQTGCDEACTFCIVPFTRGALDSRGMSDVVDAAVSMADRGASEITLSGVHLGKYGFDKDDGVRLYELVCRLLEVLPNRVRIRLSSIEVTCVEDRLVNLMASEPRLCRHFHIPLQSGDDAILEAMGRPYDSARYREIASTIRQRIPGIAITTDVMVGFPGETPDAFDNTLEVIEEVGFAKLHVFRYSAREGTPAAASRAQVSEDEKKSRSRMVRDLGDEMRLAFYRREASKGMLADVLIEGYGPASQAQQGDAPRPSLYGITDNYIKVKTSGPAGALGRYVRVVPQKIGLDFIEGELVSDIGSPSEVGRKEMHAVAGAGY
jgi:threonylcarbamoyladenosine tRNA methylthiotransferase MtaB